MRHGDGVEATRPQSMGFSAVRGSSGRAACRQLVGEEAQQQGMKSRYSRCLPAMAINRPTTANRACPMPPSFAPSSVASPKDPTYLPKQIEVGPAEQDAHPIGFKDLDR